MNNPKTIELTADIVAAHVANNTVAVGDLPNLIQSVYGALAALGGPVQHEEEVRKPAVSVRSSVKADTITCLVCGVKNKMLRRHLRTAHDLTPEAYRAEFGLPKSYPMTAPSYAERRRALAFETGLGRKPKGTSKGRRMRP